MSNIIVFPIPENLFTLSEKKMIFDFELSHVLSYVSTSFTSSQGSLNILADESQGEKTGSISVEFTPISEFVGEAKIDYTVSYLDGAETKSIEGFFNITVLDKNDYIGRRYETEKSVIDNSKEFQSAFLVNPSSLVELRIKIDKDKDEVCYYIDGSEEHAFKVSGAYFGIKNAQAVFKSVGVEIEKSIALVSKIDTDLGID